MHFKGAQTFPLLLGSLPPLETLLEKSCVRGGGRGGRRMLRERGRAFDSGSRFSFHSRQRDEVVRGRTLLAGGAQRDGGRRLAE
ncbi:hypothetical protein CDAR_70701 [Caerostris darwini]|uniref:Uncharacterized protein n=1 Tax=Caerostris darwini TaxID=1538125 RepID=A0AAV4WEG6_9ARAC|nr:hypothetical protein CDAR_70701 [Caerostris darwini]